MTTPTAQAAQPTQLFIVRRGRESTFRLLERQFAGDPSVRIIWDRRYQQRRRATEAVDTERRRNDRRAVAPTVWPATNFMVVKIKS